MGKSEKKRGNTIFGTIKTLVIGLILGFCAFFVLTKFGGNELDIFKSINDRKIKEAKVDISYIKSTINDMSDLISSELIYNGVVTYRAGGGKWHSFLTEEEFLMTYEGEVKAGVDMSKVDVVETNEKIVVTMPTSTIKFKKIKPDTIKFYDTKRALIKGNEKLMIVDAQVEAENDMAINANTTPLLENATEQAKLIISSFISKVLGNKKIEFIIVGGNENATNSNMYKNA